MDEVFARPGRLGTSCQALLGLNISKEQQEGALLQFPSPGNSERCLPSRQRPGGRRRHRAATAPEPCAPREERPVPGEAGGHRGAAPSPPPCGGPRPRGRRGSSGAPRHAKGRHRGDPTTPPPPPRPGLLRAPRAAAPSPGRCPLPGPRPLSPLPSAPLTCCPG